MAKKNKKDEQVVEEIVTPKITAKSLAAELGTTDRELRKFLRENLGKDAKPGGRWEWDEDDSAVDAIREAYAAKKAGKEADAEDEDEEFEDDEVEDID